MAAASDPEPKWLSLPEYAKRVERSQGAVHYWCRKGLMPPGAVREVPQRNQVRRYILEGTQVPHRSGKRALPVALRLSGTESTVTRMAWGIHASDATPVAVRLREELKSALRLAGYCSGEETIGRRNAVRVLALQMSLGLGGNTAEGGMAALARVMGVADGQVRRWSQGQTLDDSDWLGIILPVATQRLARLTEATKVPEV